MTNKKSKQKNQNITNFFKPFVSSKFVAQPVVSHSSLAPQMNPRVLIDSTNAPQKKKQKSVYIPVKSDESDVVEVGLSMVSPSYHFDPFLHFIA